jgi:hypothetical protein
MTPQLKRLLIKTVIFSTIIFFNKIENVNLFACKQLFDNLHNSIISLKQNGGFMALSNSVRIIKAYYLHIFSELVLEVFEKSKRKEKMNPLENLGKFQLIFSDEKK